MTAEGSRYVKWRQRVLVTYSKTARNGSYNKMGINFSKDHCQELKISVLFLKHLNCNLDLVSDCVEYPSEAAGAQKSTFENGMISYGT